MPERLTPTQALARAVKKERALLDWNQQRLAERLTELGLPTAQSTIARLETGKRGVSLDDAVALAVALDVPLPNLIAGAAVADCEIALAPKEVLETEHANAALVGRLELAEKRAPFARLDLHSPDARKRREELVRQGEVVVTTDDEGVTTTASRVIGFGVERG